MSTKAKNRVHMFVYNNCHSDARVLKEAASLGRAGYEVKIIAVLDSKTVPHENRGDFEIFRVERDSIHVKFIRLVALGFKLLKSLILLPPRIILRIVQLMVSAVHYLFPATRPAAAEVQGELNFQNSFVRILLNPHRFSFAEYWGSLIQDRSRLTVVFFYAIGALASPVYFIGRWLFGFLESAQRIGIKQLRKVLMPYHRAAVFKDYYRKAAQFVQDHPADYLHFHDLHTLPIIDELANKNAFKLVYDSHELYTEIHTLNKHQKKHYQKIEKRLLPSLQAVITVNESIAGELSQRYGIAKPTIVMNCPPKMISIPTASSLLADTAGLNRDQLIILYQGGYSHSRGLEQLIESMQWVNKGVLVMMGWGNVEEELKTLVRKLKLESKVKFIPPAAQHEVLLYTCGAHIGVIPYRAIGLNNYYTSPNKLFEYIQAGVVVAGSNFPELRRVIESSDIGDFFDPDQPKSIAECLNKLTANPERLAQLKRNVLAAADQYHWGIQEEKLLALYRDLG